MTIHKQIYRGWLEDREGLEGGDQLYMYYRQTNQKRNIGLVSMDKTLDSVVEQVNLAIMTNVAG
jgi:hypothetical protein